MHAAAGRGAARGAVALAEQVAALGLARHAAHVALLPLLAPERRTSRPYTRARPNQICVSTHLGSFPESHRAKLLRVRQLIDRDVIPVLEPLRIALGMELVDCTNMRC